MDTEWLTTAGHGAWLGGGMLCYAVASPISRAIMWSALQTLLALIDRSTQGQAFCLTLPIPQESQAGWRDWEHFVGLSCLFSSIVLRVRL